MAYPRNSPNISFPYLDDHNSPKEINNENFGFLVDEQNVNQPYQDSIWFKNISKIEMSHDKMRIIFHIDYFKSEDFTVSVQDDYIIVKVKHEDRIDINYPDHTIARKVVRKYPLPRKCNRDKIKTKINNGTLIVTVPFLSYFYNRIILKECSKEKQLELNPSIPNSDEILNKDIVKKPVQTVKCASGIQKLDTAEKEKIIKQANFRDKAVLETSFSELKIYKESFEAEQKIASARRVLCQNDSDFKNLIKEKDNEFENERKLLDVAVVKENIFGIEKNNKILEPFEIFDSKLSHLEREMALFDAMYPIPQNKTNLEKGDIEEPIQTVRCESDIPKLYTAEKDNIIKQGSFRDKAVLKTNFSELESSKVEQETTSVQRVCQNDTDLKNLIKEKDNELENEKKLLDVAVAKENIFGIEENNKILEQVPVFYSKFSDSEMKMLLLDAMSPICQNKTN